MPIAGNGNLRIFCLNVGQADTSIIVTPLGRVIVIDVCRPNKTIRLLNDLGLATHEEIDLLIITHPHDDHYSGANKLTKTFFIREAMLTPFWYTFGMGPPTYQALIDRLDRTGTKCNFLAGYTRWYPDGANIALTNESAAIDQNALFLGILGPTNGLVGPLERQGIFDTNHLSLICKLTWKKFNMVFAGDAQMENWSSFDSEELLRGGCQGLKAAHHGSCHGTQWERLARLKPNFVIVPADPRQKNNLPDAIGTMVFTKYSYNDNWGRASGKLVVVTAASGSIGITVTGNGISTLRHYHDSIGGIVDLTNSDPLRYDSNPTDWKQLLEERIREL